MSTILIAGGTGLLGQRLSKLLKEKGHTVIHLSRKANKTAEFPAYRWDLDKGFIEEEAIERADFIINLAGAGVADARWTEARKRLIIESRTQSTHILIDHFQKKKTPLKAYLSASAIGYYGDRGEDLMTENDPAGIGFLSESVMAWEDSIAEAAKTGVRTVAFRIGLVLSTKGGALEKMLLPFNAFVAPWFGDGQQWYSWVHIEDMCGMFIEAIDKERFTGIYNGVSPNPVRNKDLVLAIREALAKPAFAMSTPSFALRLAMGEMADAVLFSTKVSSEKVEKAGFRFQFPQLVPALKDLLVRKI